jgi:ABC-2 type transport system ATP-binding protein
MFGGSCAAAGAAVLFSSHQLDLVEGLCDNVVIVDKGRAVATGTVGGLRSASPHRIVRIELDQPPTLDVVWPPQLAGAEVLESEPTLFRARVSREIGPAEVLQAMGSGAQVRSFSVEPPPLSDVFIEALR